MRTTLRLLRCASFTAVFTTVVAVGSSAPAWAGPGAEMYNEFLESGALYDDPEWQAYVTEIGERVLAVTPDAGKTYTFTVVDQSMVNAFATGDAYVFVTRGILPYFQTEDELAAVIGHEIGHVVGRHSRRSVRNNIMGQILGWLGAIGTSSMAMKDLADTLTAAAGADYGRKHELESDAFSADWMVDAGYNPQAMVDAIQILRDNDLFQQNVVGRPSVYHGIMRSHPEHLKRLHDLNKRVNYEIPEEVPEPERDFMEMLDGLVFGDEAATGVVKDGVFYHGGLRIVIKFPQDWHVQNKPTEVVGRAQAPMDAYITVQRQEPPSEEQTPEEYVQKTLKRDDVINGESFEHGDMPAFRGDIEIAAGNAQKRKIGVIYRDGGVYLFKAELGANGDLAAFEQAFKETMESFRPMTAQDMREANAQRIVIVEAKPGDTFAKLARNAPISKHAEETLRVINGMHPNGEPRAGDLIKIVQ